MKFGAVIVTIIFLLKNIQELLMDMFIVDIVMINCFQQVRQKIFHKNKLSKQKECPWLIRKNYQLVIDYEFNAMKPGNSNIVILAKILFLLIIGFMVLVQRFIVTFVLLHLNMKKIY